MVRVAVGSMVVGNVALILTDLSAAKLVELVRL